MGDKCNAVGHNAKVAFLMQIKENDTISGRPLAIGTDEASFHTPPVRPIHHRQIEVGANWRGEVSTAPPTAETAPTPSPCSGMGCAEE